MQFSAKSRTRGIPRTQRRNKTSKTFWLCEGMLLIGRGRKCKKNVFHTIPSVTPEGLVVTYETKNYVGDVEVKEKSLTPEMAIRSLRPAIACTHASLQVLTLRGRVWCLFVCLLACVFVCSRRFALNTHCARAMCRIWCYILRNAVCKFATCILQNIC